MTYKFPGLKVLPNIFKLKTGFWSYPERFDLTRNNVGRNEERDPWDDNEKPRGQVVGDDVGHDVSLKILQTNTDDVIRTQ